MSFDDHDREGSMMIEKLKPFIQVDVDTLPHVIVSLRISKCDNNMN